MQWTAIFPMLNIITTEEENELIKMYKKKKEMMQKIITPAHKTAEGGLADYFSKPT